MRFLRFLYIAFASVVALYLAVNMAGLISAQYKRHALGNQITDRISEVLPTSQQFVGPVADRIGAEPTHSWTAQHCDFRTNGSGYIVVYDYRQICSLESANAWQVDSEAEARVLLGGQVLKAPPWVYGACHTYRDSDAAYAEGVRFRYIEPSAEDDRFCVPTNHEYSKRRPASGEEVPDLDGSQGWLVVIEDIELIDEVIGCASWTVVLCTNPFGDRLAWGEPVA